MKITLHGAAGEVTGSAYHIQTGRASVLLDFGMFQGGREAARKNILPPGLDPVRLDSVLLTHAHLDHTGRLPLLARAGLAAPVLGTDATCNVTRLILRDSAKVQMHDAERENRRRERAGLAPAEPLYGPRDVEALVERLRPVPYDKPVDAAPGVRARFVEAGHVLGSTSIELAVNEGGRERLVVFSGDLGPRGAPLLKDAAPLRRADLVFLESTYGDRDHRPLDETIGEFERAVEEAVANRGKILVPTFAVGRAQVLLYLLAIMFREKRVPKFPVFLDSPMAIEATGIYQRHTELLDEEFQALRRVRPLAEDLASVQTSVTPAESMAINRVEGPCLILAGAGMCNAGRILHHLKENLWRPGAVVLIVGFQAEGSLGRQLVEGRPWVRIFGQRIAVRARVKSLGGFSAHAGQTDLMRWFGAMAESRPRVVLTHGEARGRAALAALLRQRHGIEAALPGPNAVIEF